LLPKPPSTTRYGKIIVLLVNELRIGYIFDDLIIIVNRGCYQRPPKVTDYRLGDAVIGYADPQRLLAVPEQCRYLVVRRDDESEGTRQITLQQPEQVIVMNDGVFGELAHRLKDHRHIGIARVEAFEACYLLNCLRGLDIAPHGIYGVSGVNDDTALLKYKGDSAYMIRSWDSSG